MMLPLLMFLLFCTLINLFVRHKKEISKQLYLEIQNTKYKWLILIVTIVAVVSVILGYHPIYCLSWLVFLQVVDLLLYIKKEKSRN